jgi:hypothetical protein
MYLHVSVAERFGCCLSRAVFVGEAGRRVCQGLDGIIATYVVRSGFHMHQSKPVKSLASMGFRLCRLTRTAVMVIADTHVCF